MQQKLSATLLGCVLGFVAVQSGSLVACILFHMTYNGLLLLLEQIHAALESARQHLPWAEQFFPAADAENGSYGLPITTASAVLAILVLYWFHRLPYQQSEEEILQDALDHQSPHPLASEVGGS